MCAKMRSQDRLTRGLGPLSTPVFACMTFVFYVLDAKNCIPPGGGVPRGGIVCTAFGANLTRLRDRKKRIVLPWAAGYSHADLSARDGPDNQERFFSCCDCIR